MKYYYVPRPNSHGVGFYTTSMSVTDFVTGINNNRTAIRYGITADTRYVATNTEPDTEHPELGGVTRWIRIRNTRGNDLDASKILSDDTIIQELIEKISNSSAASEIINILVEVLNNNDIECTKDDIAQILKTNPDSEDLGGGVIVYSSYLIVS